MLIFAGKSTKRVEPDSMERSSEQSNSACKPITRRIGMVYICEMDNTSISSFKEQYFSKSSEITDCRFAIRTTTPEGLAFSGNDNYVNKIYTVGSIDDAIQGISFDYQLYFQPPQPEITSKITSFFETSKKCFFEEIFNEEYCGKR